MAGHGRILILTSTIVGRAAGARAFMSGIAKSATNAWKVLGWSVRDMGVVRYTTVPVSIPGVLPVEYQHRTSSGIGLRADTAVFPSSEEIPASTKNSQPHHIPFTLHLLAPSRPATHNNPLSTCPTNHSSSYASSKCPNAVKNTLPPSNS
jgi:hypothetical protein